MKYLFQLNHPAHYHLFKNSIKELKRKGHEVQILARKKDILVELLKNETYVLLKTEKGKNLIEKIRKYNDANNEILEYCKTFNPDLIIGTGSFGFVTKKLGIPSIFLGEDDLDINLILFLTGIFFYKDFSEILAPAVCNNLLWNKKTTFYHGYHELAYLHPNHFTPDSKIVEKYFPANDAYFIIRFAKLNAYHDVGVKGIGNEIAREIIELLKPHGKIYITSERELEPGFEPYRISINPLDMHHVMAFSQIYIGDSQTMAAEAGVLGVPFVRFNDFVGKIGYLNELELDYQLGYGIRTNEKEKLFKTIQMLINMPNRQKVFAERRARMLSEKIDYAKFLTWFIENYPESVKIMKESPEYQFNFR